MSKKTAAVALKFMGLYAFSRPLYDLPLRGSQPSRWARFSANRLREIWKPVPKFRDNSVRRNRTWKFSHILYTSILPEARSSLYTTSTIDPFVLIKSLFDIKEGPAPVVYINLRVSRAAFDLCVLCWKTGAALPDLLLAGFMFLFAGNLPSGSAEEKEDKPRLPRYLLPQVLRNVNTVLVTQNSYARCR